MIVSDQNEASAITQAKGNSQVQDQLNFLQSLGSTINSGMGNGALMMPFIFSQVGYLVALALLAINGILVSFSWMRLTDVLDYLPQDPNIPQIHRNQNSYTLIQAMKYYVGKQSQKLTEFISYIYLVTGSITYFLFIKNQLKFLFEANSMTSAATSSIMGPVILIGITCPIFLRLMNSKNLQNLAKFFNFGVLACVIVNIFTIFVSVSSIIVKGFDKNAMQIYDSNVSLLSIAQVFGAIIFCYDINGVLTEIRAEMEKQGQFQEIIRAYVLFMYLIMAVTGSLGYMAFGNSNQENIIATLELNGLGKSLGIFLRILLSMGMFSSIILYLYPIQQIIEKQIDQRDLSAKDKDLMKLLSLTALFLIVAIFGINFDSATRIFNIQGSIFSVFLGFVCPFILYSYHPNFESQKQKIQCIIVVTIGLIGGIIGIFASLN